MVFRFFRFFLRRLCSGLVVTLLTCATLVASEAVATRGDSKPSYAVVVSRSTADDPSWAAVVDLLRNKHDAAVVVYERSVDESLAPLAERFPRYACFVATPREAGREFVGRVHRLTRKLDEDPYTDLFWGILTGHTAESAARIARHAEPLTVRRVASATEIALDLCEEGVWYCELKQNHMVRKPRGAEAHAQRAPDDTTRALVDELNEHRTDLFVTSGHATERDWQIGFRYRNGTFRCQAGQLFGLDTFGRRYDVRSPNPKVYMPVGNCLMGHIDGTEAMALAWMNSGGVMQMFGYTVPTWFGYAGWGCLDYFLEQPGRYTFTEAFFANHHALVHQLTTEHPEALSSEASPRGSEAAGLRFDRDAVAFYGDPAWVARMATGPLAWAQSLRHADGVYTLEITPNLGERTFQLINANGSQRGGRPIVSFLPHRVTEPRIIAGADLRPVVTDDFVLIPNPGLCDPNRPYRIVFRASPVGPQPPRTDD